MCECAGQINLRDAVNRTISFGSGDKSYKLKPAGLATLMVRCGSRRACGPVLGPGPGVCFELQLCVYIHHILPVHLTTTAHSLWTTLARGLYRPRGWHLDEAHIVVDGRAMSGSLVGGSTCLLLLLGDGDVVACGGGGGAIGVVAQISCVRHVCVARMCVCLCA